MSYLSKRSREIREEEERREHPVHDFLRDRFLKPGRTDDWTPAEQIWRESVNYRGRAG